MQRLALIDAFAIAMDGEIAGSAVPGRACRSVSIYFLVYAAGRSVPLEFIRDGS